MSGKTSVPAAGSRRAELKAWWNKFTTSVRKAVTRMTNNGSLIVAGVLAIAAFIAAVLFGKPGEWTGGNVLVAVTLIGVVAVGIERVLEAGWILVGEAQDKTKAQDGKTPDDTAKELEALVAKFAKYVKEQADQQAPARITAVAGQRTPALIQPNMDQQAQARIAADVERQARAEISAAVNQLHASIDRLKNDQGGSNAQVLRGSEPPAGQKLLLIAEAAEKVEEIKDEAEANGVAVDTDIAKLFEDIIKLAGGVGDSFKDDPRRRFISICLGSALGVLVAWAFGIDLLQLVTSSGGGEGGETALRAATDPEPWPGLGVALTGFLIGLGANPAHEAIKLLQENKQSVKNANELGTVVSQLLNRR